VLNRSLSQLGFVLIVMAALLLSSCASMEKNNKMDGLKFTSLHYAKALRWGDYPGAMKMTQLPDGKVDDVDLEYLKNIKVTGYDVSPAAFNEDQTIGYTRLYLEYYNEFVNSVHTLTVDQTWKYDEELTQWFCETPMPKFKP